MFDEDVQSSLDGLLSDLPGALWPSPDSVSAEPVLSSPSIPQVDGEEQELLGSEEYQQLVSLMSQMVDLQSVDSTAYLFSPTSTQALYFRGVMLAHPFWDYYALQDSQYSYTLYYAPTLENGKPCHMMQISRPANLSSYTVRKEEATYRTQSAATLAISNLYDDTARFEGLDQLRFTAFLALAAVTALGLHLLSRIFFRGR